MGPGMIIATALKHLIAAGVTGDALVMAVAEMEAANSASREPVQDAGTRSPAAIRQSRYRNKKRNEGITGRNESITNHNAVTESDACYVTDHNAVTDHEPSRGDIYTTRAPAVFPVGLSNDNPPIVLEKTNKKDFFDQSAEEKKTKDRAFALGVKQKFERFYEIYPKKTNRKTAHLRFCAAVKSGVDPAHIVLSAERFAEAHRLAGTEKKFIPAPDAWLNKGRYDDKDLPTPLARAGPSGRASISQVRAEILAELDGENYGQDQPNYPEYSGGDIIELVAFTAPPGERSG